MPMSTESVPNAARGTAMADTKKSAPAPVEPKAPEAAAPPKLAPAAASGDAGVQYLLALRSNHEDPQKIAEVDQQLADLGFTAQ